jgi:hypothetical protein
MMLWHAVIRLIYFGRPGGLSVPNLRKSAAEDFHDNPDPQGTPGRSFLL